MEWGIDLKHRIKIKWKIFIYMLAFTAVLIAMLWLLQTVYLEDFYKMVKMNEVDNAIENVESVIDDEELEEAIDTISTNYDMSIAIVGSNGIVTTYSGEENENYIGFISIAKREELFNDAKHNDNEHMVMDFMEDFEDYANGLSGPGDLNNPNDMWQYIPDELRDKNYNDRFKKPDNGYNAMPNMPMQIETSSVLKIKIVENAAGNDIGIFAYSTISPVGATVQTLRIQLVCISIIMIVLAFALALFISWNVSRPIVEINTVAKEMAKGNYQVKYKGDGYLEVAELSETLNNTAVELGKAEALQRELIANVSHDLRTPLTMITAYSEVMRDIPGENTPENNQVIIDEAGRLSLLVNDLLDISKLQAGVAEYDMKEYNLTESIRLAVERIQKLVENNGYIIQFKHNCDVFVKADEYKLYQVIYNLINNAINYAGDDKVITVAQICAGSIVRIEVIDHGKGIAKEELKNVWDRYYKVDKNHKRALAGTGLGLSIVKNILSGHDAKYGVNSKEDEGSTFWFELKTLHKEVEDNAD